MDKADFIKVLGLSDSPFNLLRKLECLDSFIEELKNPTNSNTEINIGYQDEVIPEAYDLFKISTITRHTEGIFRTAYVIPISIYYCIRNSTDFLNMLEESTLYIEKVMANKFMEYVDSFLVDTVTLAGPFSPTNFARLREIFTNYNKPVVNTFIGTDTWKDIIADKNWMYLLDPIVKVSDITNGKFGVALGSNINTDGYRSPEAQTFNETIILATHNRSIIYDDYSLDFKFDSSIQNDMLYVRLHTKFSFYMKRDESPGLFLKVNIVK